MRGAVKGAAIAGDAGKDAAVGSRRSNRGLENPERLCASEPLRAWSITCGEYKDECHARALNKGCSP